jgi:dihydropteroate synthase
MDTHASTWQCGKHIVSLDTPIIVGILNVTPDSFSDGGKFSGLNDAIGRALEMESEGAAIIDVGGESTRPGAKRVSIQEQLHRVLPVIEGIQNRSNVLISIDTTMSQVAAAAIDAGASIINDVSAGQEDDAMFSVAGETGAGLVLMHRRLPPELDRYSDGYDEDPESEDIVFDIIEGLLARVRVAIAQGVQKNTVAIDPGLGFGKSVAQNWHIIKQTDRITASGYPVFIGASRKSFIGATFGIEDPSMRDGPSVEVAKEASELGAHIFRVHNVLDHVRVLQSQSHS